MSQYGRRNIRQFSALTTTKGCTGTLPEHPPIRINPKNSLKFGEAEGSLTEIHDDLGCACANLYGKMLESCPPCRTDGSSSSGSQPKPCGGDDRGSPCPHRS